MLVGRGPESTSLDHLLRDARAGRGAALVVRGDAGTGKSTLLTHTASAAEGFLVLRATGVESEAEFVFAALHQLLHPVLGRLDMLPEPQAAALRTAFALSDEA